MINSVRFKLKNIGKQYNKIVEAGERKEIYIADFDIDDMII